MDLTILKKKKSYFYTFCIQFELKDMKRRQDEEMLRQQDLIKKQAEIR